MTTTASKYLNNKVNKFNTEDLLKAKERLNKEVIKSIGNLLKL